MSIRRKIHGIPFLIHSPSCYVVDGYAQGHDIVYASLVFDGEWWRLTATFRQGHTATRDFQSFSHAVNVIVGNMAA